MFRISRWLLVLACAQFAYCYVIITLLFWPWPLLLLAGLCARNNLKGKKFWAYGVAQWANEDDLRQVGMVGGKTGLSIGQLGVAEPMPFMPCMMSVFDLRFTAEVACDRFLKRLRQGTAIRKRRGRTVRLSNAVHTAVFAPTGLGKGASLIIPCLLEMDESAVVLDFKGENASITARHREKMFGHQCVMLDPFHVVTKQPDTLNIFDFIEKDSPEAIDDCRDLAEQLIIRTGEEREPHWNEAAEMWIAAANIAVVQYAETDHRSLQTVRDLLTNSDRIPKLLELLSNSERLVARMGNQLGHFRDKELSSTLTTVNRHLRFLDTPAIAASTSTSSFDPKQLREGKMTVYCILPPEHMRAQTALIRTWVGSLMRIVVRGGLQRG